MGELIKEMFLDWLTYRWVKLIDRELTYKYWHCQRHNGSVWIIEITIFFEKYIYVCVSKQFDLIFIESDSRIKRFLHCMHLYKISTFWKSYLCHTDTSIKLHCGYGNTLLPKVYVTHGCDRFILLELENICK